MRQAREARRWLTLSLAAILLGASLGVAYHYTLREALEARGIEPLAAAGLQRGPMFATTEPIPDRTAPTPPELRSPADGEIVETVRPTFTWSASEDASPVMYLLQFSNDPSFPPSGTTLIGNVYTTSWTTPDSAFFMPVVKTYWRVRAVDAAANEGEWSLTRAFMTVPRV